MRLEKRPLTGREKDQEAVEMLEKLREQLFFANLTVARQTAFNLSWLQEDGMEILKEALLSESASRRARGAAAYGLRKMRGRMRKPARDILEEGARNPMRSIAQVCKNALSVLDGTHVPHRRNNRRRGRPRFEIRDLPTRGNRRINHRRPNHHSTR
jgi:methylthioribose-1-phosphate isomerase